jgi:hypothetical protein
MTAKNGSKVTGFNTGFSPFRPQSPSAGVQASGKKSGNTMKRKQKKNLQLV